jgi:hypothetical protein
MTGDRCLAKEHACVGWGDPSRWDRLMNRASPPPDGWTTGRQLALRTTALLPENDEVLAAGVEVMRSVGNCGEKPPIRGPGDLGGRCEYRPDCSRSVLAGPAGAIGWSAACIF